MVLEAAAVVQQVVEVAVVVVPLVVVLEVDLRGGGAQVGLSKATGTRAGTKTSTSRIGVDSRIGTRVAIAMAGVNKVRVSLMWLLVVACLLSKCEWRVAGFLLCCATGSRVLLNANG